MSTFIRKAFLLSAVLTLTAVLVVPRVAALEPTATIHPEQGTAYTVVFLQVRGLDVFLVGDNLSASREMELYLYWDSKPLVLGLADPVDLEGNHLHYFDVNITPPGEQPYSSLGNHTIFLEIYKDWSTFLCNFTLSFTIIESIPCPEYTALNATYYALLANYSLLLDDYDSLLTNYSSLLSNHDTLLNEHNDLLLNYNSLSANYNSLLVNFNALSSNYNSLLISYNNLHSLYSLFLANYTSLLGSYQSLNSNYNNLSANYNSLVSSYKNLESNYGALIGELTVARNLTYGFILATSVLAVVTVYLLTKRQKPTSRTR